jgi:hypothetical protein
MASDDRLLLIELPLGLVLVLVSSAVILRPAALRIGVPSLSCWNRIDRLLPSPCGHSRA